LQQSDSNSSRKWSAYSLGRLLYISGAGISKALLNEPWSGSDITLIEVRGIHSVLFATNLGEPTSFGESEQREIDAILKQSDLFKDTSFPNTLDWYNEIRAYLPTFLPPWSEVSESTPPGYGKLTGVRIFRRI
jgi:hypothetical protein